MYDFLLQLFFVSSLAVVIYLMGRALPRVSENEENRISALEYLENWVKRLPLSKIDHSINVRLEKTLRKLRVIILRIDNTIHNYLNNKKNGGSNGSNTNLFDQLDKK